MIAKTVKSCVFVALICVRIYRFHKIDLEFCEIDYHTNIPK